MAGRDLFPLVVIADDLSGAAESAAGFLLRGVSVSVRLAGDSAANRLDTDVTVFDLHTRRALPHDAADRVRRVLDAVPTEHIVMKIDSLLRGNVDAQVEALTFDGSAVVVAAGVPALNRTVRDGIVHVGGIALHTSSAWSAEAGSPPTSIAAALPSVPTVPVTLEDVRGAELADLLSTLTSRGSVPVCDVETDEDLAAIVAAARTVPSCRLVGTAALVTAVAGTRRSETPFDLRRGPESRRTLVVVGTADPFALLQVAELELAGISRIDLPAGALLDGTADPFPVLTALRSGSAVITIDGRVDTSKSHLLAARLADFVALIDRTEPSNLVLTGGETARAVLDALDIDHLEPRHEIHHGAVHSHTRSGRSVVTRPGSFGGADSLVVITDFLLNPLPPQLDEVSDMTFESAHLPLVAVTMGDGAGVGPEVIVPALLDSRTRSWCRPVVVGDTARLERAATVLGLDADIRTIGSVSEAEFTEGRINVIDLHLLPADLPWGELSAVAGDAAYHYIRVASELAVKGEVQAICTAPLNKEALHAAGHIFPGHTELLAHLTGTEEVSMMLSTPKLKVIHVTTHIGLLDAINKIEPGLVERTIRRGHEALQRSGTSDPKIGVCGINPHAGENGLFGYGEEELKIIPAVEKLKAEGMDVTGPLPADTAFFLAGRGDYDLIVAMYHDQGHGPVKVLGIESGVNITVGLPVIRTSVDHGTAFDIAGKGIAEPGSMVEALRQAAELATGAVVSS